MTMVNGELESLLAKADGYLKGIGRQENVFRLQADETVFLAVDMQNFVCAPEPGRALPGIEQVMEQVNTMADFCHASNIPVIWLRQCFSRRQGWDNVGLYGHFHQQPLDPGMFNEGEATAIHPAMHLDPAVDFVVEKTCYSAFAPGSSQLESLLSTLAAKHLILGGAATNVCVESTARDAMQHGYRTTVLTDATIAFDNLVHQVSLLNIKLFFGDTRSVESVIQEMKKQ